jgi:CPSF A subunit region
LIAKFRRHKVPLRNENIIVCATNEGSIGFITNYERGKYSNIIKLQNILRREFPYLAGLNPEAYR